MKNFLFFFLLCIRTTASVKDGSYFTNGKIPSTETHELDNGEKIYIFDDVISDAHMYALRYYMRVNDAWKMTSSRRWKSDYDVSILANTRIGSLLERIVDGVTQQNQSTGTIKRKLIMTSSYATVLRRGDVIFPINQNSDIEWTILLFLNPLWRKNSYGDVIIKTANGDVIHVQPRPGRILLLPNRGTSHHTTYQVRPPSFAETSDQFLAIFHFTEEGVSPMPQQEPAREPLDSWMMTHTSNYHDDVTTDDVINDHVFKQATNSAGEKLVVLDGLFSGDELDAMTSYIRSNQGDVFYDNHLDLDSDNVNWIAAISIDEFVELRMWKIIKENVNKYFDDEADWYPYDVSCNIITSFDHTRVHVDTSDDDVTIDEVTFLIYLTSDWSSQDYGETIFWNHLHDDVINNDYVTAVVPLYGRAVAFTGNFPHSALPPSCGSRKLRFSLAVKLLPSRYDAIMKTFEEESRHEVLANVRTIIRDLHKNSTQFAIDESKSIVTSYKRTRDTIKQLSHRAKLKQMTSCDHDWFGEEEAEELGNNEDETDENFDDDEEDDEIVGKFRANMENYCVRKDITCAKNFLHLFLHQQKERKKQASILLLSVI